MTLLDAPKFDAVRDRHQRQVLWISVGTLVVLFVAYWIVAGRPVDWPWNWLRTCAGGPPSLLSQGCGARRPYRGLRRLDPRSRLAEAPRENWALSFPLPAGLESQQFAE